MAWYNIYRPHTFDDVTGQDLVKNILQNALRKNNVRHAYLFAGSKGVGKTTLARIFAHELEDTAHNPDAKIDIIEMNAASQTGIEDIRSIIDSANIPPLSGKYKIYIIDEVHMLSKNAMSGLLKLLEEPPAYIVFLLATTNPEKLLPTIHSRLTLLKLHNHTNKQIIERLTYIAVQEKIVIDSQALEMIANKSEGSQRDAINALETVASYGLDSYNSKEVSQILGIVTQENLDLIRTQLLVLVSGKQPDWSVILTGLEQQGTDANTLLVQLTNYCLEKSFHGDMSLNSVIQVLVQLQTMRLQLSSHIMLLGLIHASVIPTTVIQATTPQTILTHPKTTPAIDTSPSPKPAQQTLKSNTNQDSQEKIKPKIDTRQDSQTHNSTPSSGPITIVQINKALQQLFNTKQCQPMLKIMAGDIQVESSIGQKISISVTNGIFETQLKTKAMLKYLEDHLNSIFVSSLKVEVVPRSTNVLPATLPDQPSSQAQQPEYIPEGPFEIDDDRNFDQHSQTLTPVQIPPQSHPQSPKNSTQNKKTEAGDIFYSVYKRLPPEIKNKKIPVHTKPIPDPRSEIKSDTAEEDDDDWDKNSESMFEFE